MNSIAKLFTYIINDRLNVWVEKERKLPESQAGFRANRGTVDNVFTLNSLIQMQLRRKSGKLFVLFIDLKSAFSSVEHKLLWDKLNKIGVSAKILNIIKDMYDKATLQVKVGNDHSNPYKVTRGVLQGEILSPLLFNLFISDIEKFLASKGIRGVSLNHKNELTMLAYADDMGFVADSYIQMKKILKALEEYFDLNRLEISYLKYKFDKYQFFYKNEKIEFVSDYIYLGVLFPQSGIYEKTARYFISRGKRAIPATLFSINKANLSNLILIKRLFHSLVSSIVNYAVEIWGIRYMKEIEKLQNLFIKRLFHLPNNTPGYALRIELGMESLEFLIFIKILNFIEKN